MSEPGHPVLPQEIITSIIDEASESADVSTLHACSTVSSSFLDPAQRHLFRSITVYLDMRYTSQNTRLQEILTVNPRLGSYVKSLTLWINNEREAERFLETFRLLQSVQELVLEGGYDFDPKIAPWDALPDTFKTDLLSFMRLPTLERLRIGYEFPLAHLASLSGLRHLECSDRSSFYIYNRAIASSQADKEWVGIQGKDPGRLESLSVPNGYMCQLLVAVLQHENSALTLSRLRRFAVGIEFGRDIVLYQNIINSAAQDLESISLALRIVQPLQQNLDVRKLSNLRHLEFEVCFWQPLSTTWAGDWIHRVLRTIPENNKIETIMIAVCQAFHLDCIPWLDIDQLLTTDRHRTTLRSVIVKIGYFTGMDVPTVSLSLPGLSAQSRLLIRCEKNAT